MTKDEALDAIREFNKIYKDIPPIESIDVKSAIKAIRDTFHRLHDLTGYWCCDPQMCCGDTEPENYIDADWDCTEDTKEVRACGDRHDGYCPDDRD